MKQKRLLAIVLCFSLVFFSVFIMDTPKAKAWPAAVANLVPEALGGTGTWANLFMTVASKLADFAANHVVVLAKVAALMTVQEMTKAIIGGPDGDTVIRDYNSYLYTSPQQRAMVQMNIFFNTTSRGRLSSANYEGVGPNYDAYLVAQARQTITGRPFKTDIQEQVTDPSQMFSGGNMKGIMSYMECGNNVACYTLTASDRYDREFARAQDIARSEQQNGFLPRKTNGRITSPALLAQSALLQIDQLGTQVIMNAEGGTKEKTTSALVQIAEGATMSIAARSANYYLSDDAGKEAIRNKNDEFPFSLGYSSLGGIGLNVGGINYGTGVGAVSGNLQIGNTCANGIFMVAPTGTALLDINGKKRCCPGKKLVAGECVNQNRTE